MPDGGHTEPRKHRQAGLPFRPIGVDRITAAASISVSPTLFDQMVDDGRMPKARKLNGRRVWSLDEVEKAFKALPTDGDDTEANPWDNTCGFGSQTGPAK